MHSQIHCSLFNSFILYLSYIDSAVLDKKRFNDFGRQVMVAVSPIIEILSWCGEIGTIMCQDWPTLILISQTCIVVINFISLVFNELGNGNILG